LLVRPANSLKNLLGRLLLLSRVRILAIATIAFSVALIPTSSIAQGPASNEENAAREALTAGNYDKAIDLFREVVRRNPKDYDTWTLLASAYFYSGLPRKALRYLKLSEKPTTLKSYNLLFQGLSYQSLGVLEKARLYLKNSAQFPDESGARAMYELGLMDYKARNNDRATHWLSLCIQRHPQSSYKQPATRLLASIRSGKRINVAQNSDQADLEAALYKYNKLSLSSTPHFWYSQIGGAYRDKSVNDKGDDGSFKPRNDQYQAFLANAGIGIGPLKNEQGTIWAGYSYFQDWITTGDRTSTYFAEPSDIEYQPFRADLMERRHQFYVDVRRDLPFHLYAGAYTRIEFARIGSSVFSGPEIQSFPAKVQDISDTTWFIPWIGYSWSTNMRTFGYLYFRKEIIAEIPDYSNKSYNFDGGSSPLSYGLTHDMEFPKFKTEATAEIYSYQSVANDPWLDYARIGGNFTVEHQVIPQLFVVLSGGYFQDTYAETILKNASCTVTKFDTEASLTLAPELSNPQDCTRNETGLVFHLGTHWDFTQFQRIAGELSYVSNSNPDQKEFDQTQLSILVTATIAFPSVKRVLRFANRFADSTFAKKDQ
jgi:tetratricopeptide (TPR) repeat protein